MTGYNAGDRVRLTCVGFEDLEGTYVRCSDPEDREGLPDLHIIDAPQRMGFFADEFEPIDMGPGT